MAFVTGNHMGHTGRIGAYVAALASAGLVGMAVTSGSPSGHVVAPFAGRAGRLATNPIAYGYPVEGGPPSVIDFSTATVSSEGLVRSLRERGLAAPVGVLQDAEGQPRMPLSPH